MIYKSLFALGVTVLAGALLISTSIAQQKPATVAKVGEKAPAFTLEDQDGKKVSLADHSGKIIVLEWFNEECPIVQRHYAGDAMNKLAAKYKEKGVVWLAINSTSAKDNAANKKADAAWKMARPILNDAAGTVGHAYGASNTPGMYVVNKDGTLAYMGAIDDNSSGDVKEPKNYVAKALDELLAGKPVSEPQTKQYGCSVKYKE